jgi:hypothetical protein
MSKRILVLTRPGDTHATAVAECLKEQGNEPTLLYTSDYPNRAAYTVSFDADGYHGDIRLPEGLLEEPDVVWLRRQALELDMKMLHPDDRQFATVQGLNFLEGFKYTYAPNAFWINRHEAVVRASPKPLQSRLALLSGLEIPRTLYSNDPVAIRRFIRECGGRAIYKVFPTAAVWKEEKRFFGAYTSVITEDILPDDEILQAVPGIYQPVVEKRHELRVTVIGRRIFAARLLSQETERGKIDFRQDYDHLRIEPDVLSPGQEAQILDFMDRIGLVFGGLDFIVTPDGQLVFLEVNQMGQFLWVEYVCEAIPLLDAFCAFLRQGRIDYEWSEADVAFHAIDFRDRAVQRAAIDAAAHPAPLPMAFGEVGTA